MIRLPASLPPDIRALFEQELGSAKHVSDILVRCAPVLLRLFNAREALTIWHAPRCRSASRAALPATADLDLPNSQLQNLTEQWLDSPVDMRIRSHLAERPSCASFSAFSWPFGSLPLPELGGRKIAIPRDYTLLIPIDSRLSVHTDGDAPFSGYLALFFDSFPQLADLPIQLIVMLPALISDLLTHMIRLEQDQLSEAALTTVHELKRGVLFAMDQLEQLQAVAPNDLGTFLGRLDRNLHRMNRAASRLLVSDRIDSGSLLISTMPISVNEIIQEVVDEMQPLFHAAHVSLELCLDEGLPVSPIDPALFPMVLSNMFENAIKYSHPGGHTVVRSFTTNEQQAVVEVLDDGMGIPPSEWPYVFQKHFRTVSARQVPGNGLGLFLAHHIVDAHGGTLELFADSVMKTAFRIILPPIGQKSAGQQRPHRSTEEVLLP